MSDDELKRILAEHHAEIRRHFDAAIDKIHTGNKILAERLAASRLKVDRIDTLISPPGCKPTPRPSLDDQVLPR